MKNKVEKKKKSCTRNSSEKTLQTSKIAVVQDVKIFILISKKRCNKASLFYFSLTLFLQKKMQKTTFFNIKNQHYCKKPVKKV